MSGLEGCVKSLPKLVSPSVTSEVCSILGAVPNFHWALPIHPEVVPDQSKISGTDRVWIESKTFACLSER